MRRILVFCLSVVFALTLDVVKAQEKTVTGRVTSAEDGSALPGVNVVIKGTTNGTVTDVNGTYKLTGGADANTLVFTFIGLKSQEVEIGGRSTIDVQMQSDITQLSEVVVVGYGTQERRDLTGSVTTIKANDLATLATPSFDQQLSGRSAGVQVSIPSGVIGQAARIRIRGTNSISSSADPLIVVDNMPINTGNTSGTVSNNPLADINPNDIESFEVLKDGSATAIYGSRAANGVILITTKKGKKGRSSFNYDTYFGWATTFRKYDVLNAQQFVEIQNEKFANAGGDPTTARLMTDSKGRVIDTDWQKTIFQTGFQQNHVASLSGATEKTNYYFSVGWTDQKGAVVSNSMNRATVRANFDHKVRDWLTFGTNMGLTRTKTVGLNTGANALSGNVFNALLQFPNVPVYNQNGSYYISGNTTGQGANLAQNDVNLPNIAYVLDHNKQSATTYRILGNTYLEASFLKDFKARTQIGVDALLNDDFLFWDPKQGDGYPSGLVYQQYTPRIIWNWQNTISYNHIFNDVHKLDVVAGFEEQNYTTNYYYAQGQNISDAFLGRNNIISGSLSTQNIGGDYQQKGFNSYFGRLNYGFNDKYLVTLTVRNDGLSSLPKVNRRGTFPGASVGWRISNEEFFKSASFLESFSDFKIRASYAQVGNTELGDYFPYVDRYAASQYGTQNGFSYSNAGNANLKWETSKKFDVGFDFGLFDNRITFTADYYKNKIDGLILQSPTAPSLGIPNNYKYLNVGRMENSGLEFRLYSENIKADNGFTWTMDINFSTNHNKVLALDKSGDITSTYNVTRVGQSIGSFLGYEYAGVNKENGNPLYYKKDGSIVQGNIDDNTYYVYDKNNPGDLSKESSLTTDDKKILGKSNPTWFGGFNNNFAYKGFDLSIFTRFSGGNKVMNLTRQNLLSMSFQNNSTEILGRWQSKEEPGNGSVPRLQYGNTDFINLTNVSSTRFLEKGDFIKIQNIVLGYTIPKNVLDRLNITKLRVYAQVQNAFIITKYKGVDPEANLNPTSNLQYGIDSNTNPQQRIYSIGLNLGL